MGPHSTFYSSCLAPSDAELEWGAGPRSHPPARQGCAWRRMARGLGQPEKTLPRQLREIRNCLPSVPVAPNVGRREREKYCYSWLQWWNELVTWSLEARRSPSDAAAHPPPSTSAGRLVGTVWRSLKAAGPQFCKLSPHFMSLSCRPTSCVCGGGK